MSNRDITRELLLVAAQRFGKPIESLHPEADFFDALGIDSLQAMDLLTEVEERFGIEIPDYELEGVTTFEALAALVKRRAG
jgi:acyl carrier protein